MTESIGSLLDELSLVELERWELRDVARRLDTSFKIRLECSEEICGIDKRIDDIHGDIHQLWVDIHRRVQPTS